MPKKSFLALFIITILISLIGLSYVAYGIFFKRAPALPGQRSNIIKSFPFSEDAALKEWEEKILKGKVVYKVEQGQSLSYVRANSDKAASALYYKIKLDAKKNNPMISWKWNADRFPVKKMAESLETKNEFDFAARVYVIFPASFFTNSKVLEYVWAETLPIGMIGTSPYSNNIKLIIVRSGPNNDKKWIQEDRDIVADYVKAFGKAPEYDIGAVAFMTNADNTLTSAAAMYDDIKLGYKE
jgi:Protein of unknown function (DUF3047).